MNIRCWLKSLSQSPFPPIILASVILMISSYSFAETMLEPINKVAPKNSAIRVVTEYLAPYQVKNADGSLGGMATEIMHSLFAQLNEDANVHVMPWARAYAMAKKNKNTLIYSIAHTPLRSEQFQWVGKIMEERLYFWSLKSKFIDPIDDIEQLKDFKVAASRYSNVAQYLIDNKFYNIHQLIKEDQNMMMLYKNRVDLIVATKLTLKNRALRLGLNFDDIHPIIEVNELNNDLCFAFSLNTDSVVVARYQNAYRQLQQKGVIDDIKYKWGVID